ncbi:MULTISPECIES: hypothetical protein [unclassified Leptolyngbya]|uniref:hypothetical protein n=1 Tax=unclassified Leptolyngbya TaxID=2650499 RepID=UPI0016882508|nr:MULTISPECIES: hypothetical protein [unclassified Leptolyngbya]MBD1914090.1 hypothetical protein [Leptolyngbya sp. FACHB-8]MBD2157313.1 hypothetical protein [Leptolyngbya sp. FACHB-16]
MATITSITLPSNETYGNQEILEFTVTFDEPVTITPDGADSVRIPVTLDAGDTAFAVLQGTGASSTTHTFSYAVTEGNLDTTGIQLGTAIELGGNATIVDAASAPATLTFPSVGDTTGILVDAVAPTITTVTPPTNGTYGVGQNLDFTVTFDEAITLTPGTGSIRLPITLDSGEPIFAELQGPGTDPNSYVFRYTIAEGNVDSNGIEVGTALELQGDATVGDAANNSAVLTLPTGVDTTGVLVDAVAPTITAVALPTNGTYGVGQNLDFAVTFSEAVTLTPGTGSIRLPITLDSGEPLFAELQGPGTDPNTYIFRYTVAEGNTDTNGIQVGTDLQLEGDATITDAANNSATLAIANVGDTTGILVDAVAPEVTTIALPSDGVYGLGQTLEFTLTFSEAVTVDTTAGTPSLSLTVGSETVDAAYISGSDTNALVFGYTVAAGDEDTDGIEVGSALNLNGGTIQDTAGNGATLALAPTENTTALLVGSPSDDPLNGGTGEDGLVGGVESDPLLGGGTQSSVSYEDLVGSVNPASLLDPSQGFTPLQPLSPSTMLNPSDQLVTLGTSTPLQIDERGSEVVPLLVPLTNS